MPSTKDKILYAIKAYRLNWTMPFSISKDDPLRPCQVCRRIGKTLWNGVVCEPCLKKLAPPK